MLLPIGTQTLRERHRCYLYAYRGAFMAPPLTLIQTCLSINRQFSRFLEDMISDNDAEEDKDGADNRFVQHADSGDAEVADEEEITVEVREL